MDDPHTDPRKDLTMWKRIALCGLAIAGLSLLTGCSSIVDESRVHKNGGDNIPWNTRADWENGTAGAGIPY